MKKIEPFSFAGIRSRVIFGHGTLVRVGEEIERLGHRQALVLSTPNQRDDAKHLADKLCGLTAGVFSEAAMHTPVEVTDRAVAAFAAASFRLAAARRPASVRRSPHVQAPIRSSFPQPMPGPR
jgi:hypothetical protein